MHDEQPDEFQQLLEDGSPAAEFIDELGATMEAVNRGKCWGCQAPWLPERLGRGWGVVVEHEDDCPATRPRDE